MRRLILWELVTLDGFCSGTKDEDPFFEFFSGPELDAYSIEQNRAVGTLLFGRKTFEGMAGYWSTQKGEVADFMNHIPKIVFSRTLNKPDWSNSTLEKRNPTSAVAELKEGTGKDLFVFGSPTLASTLSAAGLVDEYRLGIAPVFLGRGRRLLDTVLYPLRLRYLESRALGRSVVLLRMEPERTPA